VIKIKHFHDKVLTAGLEIDKKDFGSSSEKNKEPQTKTRLT